MTTFGFFVAALLIPAQAGGTVAPSLTPTPDPSLEVYAKPQRIVTLATGRRMNVYCTGDGSPTVILEGGWTANTASWRKVQAPLAQATRVCSYDRAGYGFSDAGPQPRTAQAIVDDLANMLTAADIRGPYILVAHSLGALSARLFVDEHPKDVVGLVLVDPAVEYQDRDFAKVSAAKEASEKTFEANVKACSQAVIDGTMTIDLPQRPYCIDGPSKSVPASVNAARLQSQSTSTYQAAVLSELVQFPGASSDQVAKSRHSWGDLPVVVLTAQNTQNDPDLSEADQQALTTSWWSMHERVVTLSTRGEHRLVPQTGHMIPSQRPQAVIDATMGVLAQARGKPTK